MTVCDGIGVLSFCGPAGQIAPMHRMLVEERKWIDERHCLSALNLCMLLPGPEAMQSAGVRWLALASSAVAFALLFGPHRGVITTLAPALGAGAVGTARRTVSGVGADSVANSVDLTGRRVDF